MIMLAGYAVLIFLASQDIRNALFKSGLGVQTQINVKNLQHTQRSFLNFENWTSGEP